MELDWPKPEFVAPKVEFPALAVFPNAEPVLEAPKALGWLVLVEFPNTPPELEPKAEVVLVFRPNGEEFVLAALPNGEVDAALLPLNPPNPEDVLPNMW